MSNQAAWITEAKAHPFKVDKADYWQPGPNQVLIKNAAVAVNPVDWKVQVCSRCRCFSWEGLTQSSRMLVSVPCNVGVESVPQKYIWTLKSPGISTLGSLAVMGFLRKDVVVVLPTAITSLELRISRLGGLADLRASVLTTPRLLHTEVSQCPGNRRRG